MKNYMITNEMMQMCAGILKQGCTERVNCYGCIFKDKDIPCVLCKGFPANWKEVQNQKITFPEQVRQDTLQLPALIGTTVIYKSLGEIHIMTCADKKTAEQKWKELNL